MVDVKGLGFIGFRVKRSCMKLGTLLIRLTLVRLNLIRNTDANYTSEVMVS